MFERVTVEVDDAVACANALAATVATERHAAAERFALVATWADMHCPPSPDAMSGAERERQRSADAWGGAEGTPSVTPAAATELGMLLQLTTHAAQRLLREVLDLRHRLPRLYDGVLTGQVQDWKAREVARRTHHLSLAAAGWVDREVHAAVIGLPWGRALHVIEGKVIAADPLAHRARLAEEENRLFVSTRRRSTTAGLRTLIARGTAGDIARIEAMVAHLATLLASAGDTDPADVRRAKGFAMLANPALACVFLATGHGTSGPADADNEIGEPHSEQPAEDEQVAHDPRQAVAPDDHSAVELAVAFGRLLHKLGAKALDRLRPRSVLYLHLSADAVAGLPGASVCRVEDPVAGGPIGVEQLRSWLRNHRVTVRPVLDPTGARSVDAYETTAELREALRLLSPYEAFPYGTLPASRADADHTVPYVPVDEGGPPGQTAMDNLGPLGRGHHLAKTFDGFVVHQPVRGVYFWRTPTGHWYQVDHRGTRPLGRDRPAALDAPVAAIDTRAASGPENHFRDLLVRHLAA